MNREPSIRVGLAVGGRAARLTLSGRFTDADGESLPAGDYSATIENGAVTLDREKQLRARSLRLSPSDFDADRVTVHDVTIGVNFHWQREESQSFQGSLELTAGEEGLMVVNELPLESYLVGVISSEMSAACPPALLRAHAIVSRGWLLAQLRGITEEQERGGVGEQGRRRGDAETRGRGDTESEGVGEWGSGGAEETDLRPSTFDLRPPTADHRLESITHHASRITTREIIRWYDRENHEGFDVCADDHCQRYQGLSKAFSSAAFDAVSDTRGKALMSGGEICDARYTKSCGGRTEVFSAAWEDKDVAYLASIYDGEGDPDGYAVPLTVEANAEAWIASSPKAYCNTTSPELLARILTGFDQETMDFYRWEVSYEADELGEIIESRLGIDLGPIVALEPLARGESGRITRLKIAGEKESIIIGKELEIRRALSRSHLYSSAFVARAENDPVTGNAERFRMIGAGWGHGVGLCQIGAAVLADLGRGHEEILAHYFRNARLETLY